MRVQIKNFFLKKNVQCPICLTRLNKFEPFGRIKREGELCPQCGSLERHRTVWMFLQNETSLFDKVKMRVLHFAPEKHLYKKFKSFPWVEYYPCDLNPGPGEMKADITDIPFQNNFFDMIIANHVLEHIPDDKKAMSELYRVMRSPGIGIFQVPIRENLDTHEDFSITDPKEREKYFGQNDHVRLYGRDYLTRFSNAGFRTGKKILDLPESKMKLHGLVKQYVYHCMK